MFFESPDLDYWSASGTQQNVSGHRLCHFDLCVLNLDSSWTQTSETFLLLLLFQSTRSSGTTCPASPSTATPRTPRPGPNRTDAGSERIVWTVRPDTSCVRLQRFVNNLLHHLSDLWPLTSQQRNNQEPTGPSEHLTVKQKCLLDRNQVLSEAFKCF